MDPRRRFPLASLRIALVAGLAWLAGSSPASALGMGDVDYLEFPSGGMNTGIANPGFFDYALDASIPTVCTGGGVFQASGVCMGHEGYQITIGQQLQTVHQNPQAQSGTPSGTNPFIADSLWTATNTSGQALPPVLLLFTSVNLASFPGAHVPGYPNLEVGLDGNLLEIVRFTSNRDYYFGAVNLGSLAPGESTSFLVRYVVTSGPMPIADNNVVMPPLKVVGMAVPEPGTLVLLVAGLAGIALAGRTR